MDVEMAYLLGMILGNGTIQRSTKDTLVTIDIPHKNLYTHDRKEISIYVKASIIDIRNIISPLIGSFLNVTDRERSTTLSFKKSNDEYLMREIIRLICNGTHHTNMKINKELFNISIDEKKALLRGIADVTGYIRLSNVAFGQKFAHRVYIEIPQNWELLIDIANLLKDIEIPVQTIDFAHPNFRDSNLTYYKKGNTTYWKKEHQLKIFANEFFPIGFYIKHKQQALEEFSAELIINMNTETTHKFYWEKQVRRRNRRKPIHPSESDNSLPAEIRGMHFESWTDLARILGYGK